MHIGKVELLLALVSDVLGILDTEETLTFTLLTPLAIFLRRQQNRGIQVGVTQL